MGDSNEFFRAPNGKYYKTEEVYNEWQRTVGLRRKCIDELADIAGYNKEVIIPTYLNKMLNEIGDKVGFDVLLETIHRNQKGFEWANENREFHNEIARINYYRSIILNNVVEVYKEAQIDKEQAKRENDFVPPDDLKAGKIGGKGKDLSSLLGQF